MSGGGEDTSEDTMAVSEETSSETFQLLKVIMVIQE